MSVKLSRSTNAGKLPPAVPRRVVARRMLRTREGDVERGILIDAKVGLVTFHEAAEQLPFQVDLRVGEVRLDPARRRIVRGGLQPDTGTASTPEGSARRGR